MLNWSFQNERLNSSTACTYLPDANSPNDADDTLATSEVRRRTLLTPQGQAEQDSPGEASNSTWPSQSPLTTPLTECTEEGTQEVLLTYDKGSGGMECPTVPLRELWKMDPGPPECSSVLRRLQTLALPAVPAPAAHLDPFSTSGVQIDAHMARLLTLYTDAILPRVRLHKMISKACSNLAELHALRHPMVLYAILCRASIEPQPQDGDPQDGSRMHQASISRAGTRESIKFKLQAIKHLNEQISGVQLQDDYFPILHTMSLLLRIEVSFHHG